MHLTEVNSIHSSPGFSISQVVFHFDHLGKACLDLLLQQFDGATKPAGRGQTWVGAVTIRFGAPTKNRSKFEKNGKQNQQKLKNHRRGMPNQHQIWVNSKIRGTFCHDSRGGKMWKEFLNYGSPIDRMSIWG